MGIKKTFAWKKNLPRIIWGTILLILIACLAKVAIWEKHYYAEKEGSTRATVVNNAIAPEDTAESVDEGEITAEDTANYTVTADKPRYLSIEKLGIVNARIIEVGLSSEGRLQTPSNIFDVGWYRSSAKPGTGGTLLIDGHNGGPTTAGVFKRLPELNPGDTIKIERGDGKIFTYSVVENNSVALSEADSQMSKMQTSPVFGKESISLITCTGTWSLSQQTFLERQFLRAVLI